MTYRDLIRSSLRLIGQLGPGRGPNVSETTDALFVLNAMLESFSIESLNIYAVQRKVYSPPAGATSYRIGCGGELSLNTRPVRIEGAERVYAGATCGTALTLIGRDEWTKGQCGVYYDGGWPCGTIYLDRALQSGEQLALWVWGLLTGPIEDVDETVSFPPGYADAIRYQLAVRLAPEWGKAPRPDVMQLAVDALAKVKSFNSSPPPVMDASDGGALSCGGNYDICSDSYC